MVLAYPYVPNSTVDGTNKRFDVFPTQMWMVLTASLLLSQLTCGWYSHTAKPIQLFGGSYTDSFRQAMLHSPCRRCKRMLIAFHPCIQNGLPRNPWNTMTDRQATWPCDARTRGHSAEPYQPLQVSLVFSNHGTGCHIKDPICSNACGSSRRQRLA